MTRLRVMTYNVRSLRDDAAAVGRVMRSAAPDLVIVQEAPRFLRWRTYAAAIARRAGLVVISGGRPARGNLLIGGLRVDVVATRDVPLTRVPRLHHRAVTLANLRVGNDEFAVAGTHLDLDPAARLMHAHEVRQALADLAGDRPLIVGADTNDEPGSPPWQVLGEGLLDAATAGTGRGQGPEAGAGLGPEFDTFTAANPKRRIDALLVSPAFTVVRVEVIGGPDVVAASDHRPVLVELDLSGR